MEGSKCDSGGDKENVASYRSVSVLPVIVKLFEQLFHKQLYN